MSRSGRKPLTPAAPVDPAADHLRVKVSEGDLLGFAVEPRGESFGQQIQWVTTLDYGQGKVFSSDQDTSLSQGPIWSYAVRVTGTGVMEPLDKVETPNGVQGLARISDPQGSAIFYGERPYLSGTLYHPVYIFQPIRLWRAPTTGTVEIRGAAKLVQGGETLDLRIVRIRPSVEPKAAQSASAGWKLESAEGRQVSVGGRPAVQLDLTLSRQPLRAQWHILAFPHTPILRHWLELENAGSTPFAITTLAPMAVRLSESKDAPLTHHWMIGANSLENQGMMRSDPLAASYHREVAGYKTDNYTPLDGLSIPRRLG